MTIIAATPSQLLTFMAEIIDFPSLSDREWNVWEQTIRRSCIGTQNDEQVLARALPSLREHWDSIFEPLTLELPKRAVPGTLTQDQAQVIQEIISSSADLVVTRLKTERTKSMARIIPLELQLAFLAVHQR